MSADRAAAAVFTCEYYNLHYSAPDTNAYNAVLTVLERQLPSKARILDVGCGNGLFLEQLHRRGRRGIGIDPSPAAVEMSRSRGVSCYLGRLLTLEVPEAVDCVTFLSSLNYEPDLTQTLQKARTCLVRGGYVLIRSIEFTGPYVMLAASLSRLPVEKMRRYAGVALHITTSGVLWLFSRASLAALMARAGFEIQTIVQEPRKWHGGGSFRSLVHQGLRAITASGRHTIVLARRREQ